MVPGRVLVRDGLPKTTNGKLDRNRMRALMAMTTTDPAYATNPPADGTPGAATVTGQHGADLAERVIAEVWADLLDLERVDPHDNFFELGGDSILGVRVVARAAKAGVHFTPQQILQHRTLRELAASAAVRQAGAAAPPGDSATPAVGAPLGSPSGGPIPLGSPSGGPIPLSPLMHRFFTAMGDRFRDFLIVTVLEATAGHGDDAVRAALEHLVAAHEPLRYRFRRNSLGWRIECAGLEPPTFFDTRVLPPMTEAEELAVIQADCEQLRREVDLERGPALRARFYRRGRGRNGLILLLTHHFVFDNMSSIAILDDLDAALADVDAGRAPSRTPLPPVWREWSHHLYAMAQSDELAGELEYWTAILRAGAAAGGLGATPREPGEPGGPVRADIRVIDADRVAAVLRSSGGASREAAYCAAACGLARWRGTSGAYLLVEGQATVNRYRPRDRAAAVGWFTTAHPLMLPVAPGATAAECLPDVIDHVRSVPHDGVGYGILRHLSLDSPSVARLRALPEPEVLVDHMATDGSSFDRGIRRLRSRLDLFQHLKRPDTAGFPLVITTSVEEGPLTLGVAHDGGFTAEDIGALTDHLVDAFLELA
jgi:hypothetical protein